MIYELFIRPLLFAIYRNDPETAHELALQLLEFIGNSKLLRQAIAKWATLINPRLETEILGLKFRNPIGLAAGFDKNGVALPGLEALGFGFLEAGTVTQHGQSGNLRPRIFRFPKDQALVNRMGFNNNGSVALAKRLKLDKPKLKIPIGVSIGKSKITAIEKAVEDYAISLIALYPYADYFAVNVSSPNTPNLRSLQDKGPLKRLLLQLVDSSKAEAERYSRERIPLLLKIAPDLTIGAIDEVLDVIAETGVNGIIATNTTITREGLSVETTETGGMSGQPLFEKSLAIVQHIRKVDPKIPIIGVGGISTPEQAYEMLEGGADLLQIYTSFIYGGPLTVRNLNEGLLAVMNQHCVDTV